MALTAKQKLDNLADALLDDVVAMTDDELLAEVVEELVSIKAVEAEAARIRDVLLAAFSTDH